MSRFFSFPDPVNEKAARVVAGVVMIVAIVAVASPAYWLLIPLAYGFLARVLAGPTFSPLGRLASSVVAPRLGPAKPVAGPPKRFAQGMGAVITTAAAILALGLGEHAIADGLLAALIAAAGLEAAFAFCLGCRIFSLLIRVGLVPETACVACADIGLSSPRVPGPAHGDAA